MPDSFLTYSYRRLCQQQAADDGLFSAVLHMNPFREPAPGMPPVPHRLLDTHPVSHNTVLSPPVSGTILYAQMSISYPYNDSHATDLPFYLLKHTLIVTLHTQVFLHRIVFFYRRYKLHDTLQRINIGQSYEYPLHLF